MPRMLRSRRPLNRGWRLMAAASAIAVSAAAGVMSAPAAQAAARTVAITFDDGPSTVYTPQILSILARYRVPATFFEIGRNVAAHPGVTRRVYRAGDSVQNHTWAHRNLRRVSWNTFRYQVTHTDSVIRAQTGYTPRCLRPPFGAVSSSVYARAARLGKRVVLWTVDPKDWSRPGTATIVRRVLNNVRSGSIVLFHDGGGNRSQTVAALPTILRTLRARGYTFTRIWC